MHGGAVKEMSGNIFGKVFEGVLVLFLRAWGNGGAAEGEVDLLAAVHDGFQPAGGGVQAKFFEEEGAFGAVAEDDLHAGLRASRRPVEVAPGLRAPLEGFEGEARTAQGCAPFVTQREDGERRGDDGNPRVYWHGHVPVLAEVG